MMYKYNSDLECFERFDEDGKPRGRKLWVNITEARRIVTLHELGNSIGLIQSKMTFASNRASGHTVETIINLHKNGEIELDGDFPAPSKDFESLSVDGRIDALEDRIKNLEDRFSELKSDCFCSAFAGESKKENGLFDKVKSWI